MQQLRLFFATAKNKRNCCILLDLFHYEIDSLGYNQTMYV